MGQGIIRISQAVMRDLLLLPSDFQVVAMFYDFDRGALMVAVDHPSIPAREIQFDRLPDVSPIYSVVETDHGRTVVRSGLTIEGVE